MGGVLEKINSVINISDIIIIIISVLILVAFIFLLKKEKIVALILSIYLGYIFVDEILMFNSTFLGLKVFSLNMFIAEAVFVVMIAVLFLLLLRTGFFRSYAKSHYRSGDKNIFLNILAVGLFVTLSLRYFLPPFISQDLGFILQYIFNSSIGYLLWIIIPMFTIFLVKRD